MTTDAYAPSAVGERIRDLCKQFRLPTLAAETVERFSAGYANGASSWRNSWCMLLPNRVK